MTDVTIRWPADKTDLLRRICFYEFIATDDLWRVAESHHATPFWDTLEQGDIAPLEKELSRITTAKRVLDEIGWLYGEPSPVEQITADREWLSTALEYQWREIMDITSGNIHATEHMRLSADAADLIAGILDEIGWPEKDKPEPAKVGA